MIDWLLMSEVTKLFTHLTALGQLLIFEDFNAQPLKTTKVRGHNFSTAEAKSRPF